MNARLELLPPTKAEGQDRYLTPEQAAKYINVSSRSLKRFCEKNVIPAIVLPGEGGRHQFLRFDRNDLDTFMQRHKEHQ